MRFKSDKEIARDMLSQAMELLVKAQALLASESAATVSGPAMPVDRALQEILAVVAGFHSVSVSQITENQKSGPSMPESLFARRIAMYFMRSVTGASYPRIARVFSAKMSHVTVIHAERWVAGHYTTDKRVRRHVNALRELLGVSGPVGEATVTMPPSPAEGDDDGAR